MIFCYEGFIRIGKEKQINIKFGETKKWGIFVEYEEIWRNYRVWISEKRKIGIRHDVECFESLVLRVLMKTIS